MKDTNWELAHGRKQTVTDTVLKCQHLVWHWSTRRQNFLIFSRAVWILYSFSTNVNESQ